MKYSNIPILMYHEISNKDNQWCVSPQQFKQQMLFLKQNGYKTISPTELKNILGGERKREIKNETNEEINKTEAKETQTEEKLIVITFDDARKGIYDYAFHLLKKLGFTATIYVVPKWIENKSSVPLQENYSEFLSWIQLKELANSGWEIGSHSLSHKNLIKLNEQKKEDLAKELSESKKIIERKIEGNVEKKKIEGKRNYKIKSFSYPFGLYNILVLDKVKKEYETAVTTNKGFAKSDFIYSRQWIVQQTSLENFSKLLKKPTIALCMIVKNEEQFLEQCLASVKNLVDEIIIVDTGSKDRTKEIAAGFTNKIYDFNWCDDFAAARNESLKHAASDWILMLDADEVINRQDYNEVEQAVNNWDVAGYRIMTRNYSNDSSISGWLPCKAGDNYAKSFQGWFPSLKVRLFQRKEEFCFRGKMHEMIDQSIEQSGEKIVHLHFPVHHYGALKPSAEKTKRYLELTKQKLQDNPKDAKAYFEAGVQYKALGNFSLAEQSFAKSIKLNPKQITPLLNLAIVQQKQGKTDTAIKNFTKIIERNDKAGSNTANKNTKISRGNLAEAHFGLGFCFFKKNELEKSAEHFQLAVRHNPQYLDAYINLGAVYEKLGKFSAAVTTLKKALLISPHSARCYYNLGVVYEKMVNVSAAIESYQKAIDLNYFRKEELLEKLPKMKSYLNAATT